jgi:hypothetical protein
MGTPRGFRDISTTYQMAYSTIDGSVQVRKIGSRLWEILGRGGLSVYETAKEAALKQARKMALARPKAGVRRAKRKARR